VRLFDDEAAGIGAVLEGQGKERVVRWVGRLVWHWRGGVLAGVEGRLWRREQRFVGKDDGGTKCECGYALLWGGAKGKKREERNYVMAVVERRDELGRCWQEGNLVEVKRKNKCNIEMAGACTLNGVGEEQCWERRGGAGV